MQIEVHDMTTRRTIAALAIAGFAAFCGGGISAAVARPEGQLRVSRTPVLAVVGLAEQRISIYDATGNKYLEAPVSSGATGYETPAGIYSIVQKEEDHHSNLYDDASMPYMERITWTGMALHAGELPGYPASHGCVRMPLEFAERLYQITNLGMRVVVVREDIAPAEIAQPSIFASRAEPNPEAPVVQLMQLRSSARAKIAEAGAATMRERNARQAAARRTAEATQATRMLRAAEGNLARAEAELKAAERALEKPGSPARTAQLELAKTNALAKVEATRTQVQTVKAQVQPKMDAVAPAEEEAKAAAAAMNVAIVSAEEAKQNLSPVSVFISRKTQRLYIRRAHYPVYEGPVTIRDADKPLGTFVFTALNPAEESGATRWNVVSMYKDATNVEPYTQAIRGQTKARRTDPAQPADVAAAKAALDRLDVPPETAEHIAAVVLPGSSLIVSDEGPSVETGKDTDFVVFMSGEPQGGIAIRRRNTVSRAERDDGGFALWGSPPPRGGRSSSSSSWGIFPFKFPY